MIYLGVDGGGTKTTFMLINDKGDILSFVERDTIDYVRVGHKAFQKTLTDGIEEVCGTAGVKISHINYSFLGIPCFGDEIIADVPIIESVIKMILNSDQFKCANDAEAGWAGSLACQPGVNLVAGTGAIGYGLDKLGRAVRSSGWGHFCGDEGSAYWLGKQAIALFTKQSDGRDERTLLYDIVKQHFNLQNDFDLLYVIYEVLKLKRDQIAKLALLLYKAAKMGDQKAIAIFRNAADELCQVVHSVIKQLDFKQNERILVSYSGGVFKAGSYILTPFRKGLSSENIQVIEPILLPVTGAALYALKLHAHANDHSLVVERLKEQETKMLCHLIN